jgi:zinc protease
MKKLLIIMVCLLVAASSSIYGEQKVTRDTPVLVPVNNDPTVSFILWFKVGSQNDPPGKEGLASITASMLADASTQKNSYEEILDKLFPLAASYNASTSVEMTVITGRTHKDNLKEYYPLLIDAILFPAFKQEDLDRIKSQVLNYLEHTLRYSSDEELGKAVLYNEIFAGTPYGHIPSGLVESVKSITIDDVKKFYEEHYRSGNLTIGVGGGYDHALVRELQSDLKRLPPGAPKAIPKPRTKTLKGVNVSIVAKDAQATAISIGFPINILRGSKDWYALAIANSWLGQHRNSSSHLYQVIREERGLNYGDYSYIEHFPGGGGRTVPPQNVARRQQIFEIWIRPVPNETRQFALRAGLHEFKHLVEHGLSESEFTLTTNFLRKYVLHYASTTFERLGYAIDDRFYAIKGSHLTNFRKAMDNVSRADVNAAIKKYWQYGNMEIAMVTNDAQLLKDALVNDTPSPITYKTPKPDSILEEDKQISSFPLKVKPENVQIVPVERLFVKR